MPIKNDQDLQEMKDDLMKVYKEVAPFCKSQNEAWKRTVLHPAPRYYLSEPHAIRVIKSIINGETDKIDKMPSTVKRRCYSLYNEVLRLSENPKYTNKPIVYLVRLALYNPAPEFFLTTERFRRIFYEEKNKKYIGSV